MSVSPIRDRMLEIAARRGLTHLGSCCSVLPILCRIYEQAGPDDVVILSNGHAGLALYCVLEHFRGQDAEALYDRFGTHPERDEAAGIFCTTGSLGCGLAVAVGYALAGRKTHVVISDGECAEGIVWECLAFLGRQRILRSEPMRERALLAGMKPAESDQIPIEIWVNANGFSALDEVDVDWLESRIGAFFPHVNLVRTTNYPMPAALQAHYMKLPADSAEMPVRSSPAQTPMVDREPLPAGG